MSLNVRAWGVFVVVAAVIAHAACGAAAPMSASGSSMDVAFPGAPQQSSPADGSVFSNFPRVTTVTWKAVSGAAGYGVEVDCFQCCQSNRWCSDVRGNPSFRVDGTSYTFTFFGAQPGRWRVWAVDANGREGTKSGWWTFTYLQ